MLNASDSFERKKGQLPVSNFFLTSWIKSTHELHVIESKSIVRTRAEMHSLDFLMGFFEREYIVALK